MGPLAQSGSETSMELSITTLAGSNAGRDIAWHCKSIHCLHCMCTCRCRSSATFTVCVLATATALWSGDSTLSCCLLSRMCLAMYVPNGAMPGL